MDRNSFSPLNEGKRKCKDFKGKYEYIKVKYRRYEWKNIHRYFEGYFYSFENTLKCWIWIQNSAI